MYRKLTSLRWHTYLPADAGETFTSTLDLFFAGPFLFAKPELAKHKNSRKTLLSSIFREFYIHAVWKTLQPVGVTEVQEFLLR